MAKVGLKTLMLGLRKKLIGGVLAQYAQDPGLYPLQCQKSKW